MHFRHFSFPFVFSCRRWPRRMTKRFSTFAASAPLATGTNWTVLPLTRRFKPPPLRRRNCFVPAGTYLCGSIHLTQQHPFAPGRRGGNSRRTARPERLRSDRSLVGQRTGRRTHVFHNSLHLGREFHKRFHHRPRHDHGAGWSAVTNCWIGCAGFQSGVRPTAHR